MIQLSFMVMFHFLIGYSFINTGAGFYLMYMSQLAQTEVCLVDQFMTEFTLIP